MVGTNYTVQRQQFTGQRTKPPPHAIADNSIADLLGYGDAKAHGRITVLSRPHQKNKAALRGPLRCVCGKEIPARSYDCQADSFLRPRARRA
jgi:hypothetical protein